MKFMAITAAAFAASLSVASATREFTKVHLRSQFVDKRERHPNHVWSREQEIAAGIELNNYKVGTAPHETMDDSELPEAFTWWCVLAVGVLLQFCNRAPDATLSIATTQ